MNQHGQMTLIQRGKPFPHPPEDLPLDSAGAIFEGLREGGSTILLTIPHVTENEERAVRFGEIKMGLIVKQPLIMLIMQITGADKAPMTMEMPFNVKRISDLTIPKITGPEDRLMINLYGVDPGRDNNTFAVRAFTFHPTFTEHLFWAVQNQLVKEFSAIEFQRAYQVYAEQYENLRDIPNQITMYEVGV